MLSPMLTLVPSANVGFVALERNHISLIAAKSYVKIPSFRKSLCRYFDPMLATGGSLAQTVDEIKHTVIKTLLLFRFSPRRKG